MALPSSNPQNRVSIAASPVPVPSLADLTIRPAEQAAAFGSGFGAATGVASDLIIRPSQAAAQVAANADAASASRAGIQVRPSVVDATIAEANLRGETAKRDFHLLKDPGYLASEALDQVNAIEGDLFRAQAEVERLGKDPEAQAEPDYGDQLMKARDKVRNLEWDLSKAKDTAKLRQAEFSTLKQKADAANIQAGTDVLKSQTENAITFRTQPDVVRGTAQQIEGAMRAVPEIVANEAEKRAQEGILLRTQTNVLGQDAVQQALFQSGVAQPIIAAEQAKQALAAVASGQAISPAAQEQLYKVAEGMKIPVVDASGQPRPLGQISADIQKQGNVTEAAPVLKEIREASSGSAETLDAANFIGRLLDSGVGTGAIWGLPGIEGLDRIAAQIGYGDSQAREQIRAQSIKFVAQVRKNFPGQVSNFEMRLYEGAVPGVKASPETNRALLASISEVAQRAKDKETFFSSLVGPLSVSQVQERWNTFTEKNPIVVVDETNQIRLNPNRLTAQEWAKAYEDPATAIQQARVRAQQNVDFLPPGALKNNRAVGDARYPFVNVNGNAVRNAAFWSVFEQ